MSAVVVSAVVVVSGVRNECSEWSGCSSGVCSESNECSE